MVACLLYLYTLDTGLQPEELRGGDLITHQYAQVEARPSNAPGYPLYTMGGWLWFRVMRGVAVFAGEPWPNPMPLLSSYSTLWALVALWLLFRILIHLFLRVRYSQQTNQLLAAPYSSWHWLQWLFSTTDLTRVHSLPSVTFSEWLLATLLSLFYGVTYFFWYYATTTEQYSSAIAQTLAIVYFYLMWQDSAAMNRQQPRSIHSHSIRPHSTYLLLLLAFLCGLSLAHMLTVAFIVPPLLIVLLWQEPLLLRQWRIIILAIGAAALPLVSYLYVYLRGAAHPEWWGSGEWRTTQEWFWHFVSTTQGREELGWGLEPWCTSFANGFPMLIAQELTWPVLVLGLLGFCLMGKRLATFFWGITAIYFVFNWAYRCGNWFQVILPLYPLLVIGFALTIYKLLLWIAKWASAEGQRWRTQAEDAGSKSLPETKLDNTQHRWVGHFTPTDLWSNAESLFTLGSVGVSVLLLLVILMQVNTRWPTVDSRGRAEDSALDQAALLLTPSLPENQALFASLDETLALQYVTRIAMIRPDLRVVSSQQAATELASGTAVYSTWELASTLVAELPEQQGTIQRAIDPRWIRFDSSDGQAYFLADWLDWALPQTSPSATPPSDAEHFPLPIDSVPVDREEILAQQVLARQLLPTVKLQAYRVTDVVSLLPNLDRTTPERTTTVAANGFDLLLVWQVENGAWPEGVAISLRLTAGGNPIEGAQIDRQEPAMGLNKRGTELDLLPDPYYFSVPDGNSAVVDGALLILYRPTDDGFENLAIVPLPWP